MNSQSGGLHPWLMQRLSAVYIGLFLIFFTGMLISNPPSDYQVWRQWVAHPLNNVLFLLFWSALLLHGWVGIRDVLMDYISLFALRLLLLSLFGLFFIAMFAWSMSVLLSVVVA